MTWYDAANLFEDLARMGLTSASVIERAYMKDPKIMWRLATCFAKTAYLQVHLWGDFRQIITACPYYRPYFRRSRRLSSHVKRLYLTQIWYL